MFTWNAKLILEVAGLLKHLDTVVVGVSDDYVLIHAKAEAMRWVELAFSRAELAKLTPVNTSHVVSWTGLFQGRAGETYTCKHEPWGELNWPFPGPSWPNLHL